MDKSAAIVVCAWPPQGGGIGNNAYYHAGKLAERGWKIGVFTADFPGIKPASGNYHLSRLKAFLRIGKAGFLRGLNRELAGYGIIHLYYPFFGTDLLVWLYKKRNPGVKLVLHYEMDPAGEGIKRFIFMAYMRLFLGLLVRAADRVCVLSYDHGENSYLAPYLKAIPGKFVELPNGIDVGLFQPQEKDGELMKLNNISVQDRVVIFVGGLDSQHYFKGVPVLLQAFSQLPVNYFPDVLAGGVRRGLLQELRGESKLLVIGAGDLRQQFEAEAERLGIAGRVRFVGWIPNEELPKYYAMADVFVLPSTARTESFGIVVAEAQACGLPVVVSDWPGVRATLVPGLTGCLALPGNAADLAAKLKLLLSDEKLRREFGSAGTVNAQKYDWDKVALVIEEIYSRL